MFVGVCSFIRAASRWDVRRRGHGSKEALFSDSSDELHPLGASKDSHSHCFSFNLQTASMFYVKRSWQPTLFLYVFIIQDERWRNKRRSVKVKYGTLLTSGHEAPGASPAQKGRSVVSPSLLLTRSASRLPIESKVEELFHRSRLRID